MTYIPTTTELTNFDLHFGWMMDKVQDYHKYLEEHDFSDDDGEPVDSMDALAYATVRFEDVEEELAEQAWYLDRIDAGDFDPDVGSSWDE